MTGNAIERVTIERTTMPIRVDIPSVLVCPGDDTVTVWHDDSIHSGNPNWTELQRALAVTRLRRIADMIEKEIQ